MKVALIPIFFFLINQSFGQTKPAGSLANAQNIKTADSLFNLGKKYDSLQNYRQALPLIENSLKIYEVIGEERKVGDCQNYLGTIYFYQGDLSKSLYFFEKSVDAYKKVGYKKGIS